MLEHLVEEGFEQFDLGLGYERYKASWSKKQLPLMETVYPLSVAALPFKWYLEYKTQAKDQIKQNRLLWAGFKRLRKLFGKV